MARLGHKIIGKVASVGKKVLKGIAIGGAFGSALLTGASYSVGKKEQQRQSGEQQRIREEAEAEIKRREDSIPKNAPPPPPTSKSRGYNKKVVKNDSFIVDSGSLTQKDPLAPVGGIGPQMDEVDLAMAMAQQGKSAAASFESKKIGGVKQKAQKLNPFSKTK